VPEEEQLEGTDSEQATEKILVVLSPQFGNELLPGVGDVNTITVFESEAIMTLLPMHPFSTKEWGKQGRIGQSL
jgi:hypothetical protein